MEYKRITWKHSVAVLILLLIVGFISYNGGKKSFEDEKENIIKNFKECDTMFRESRDRANEFVGKYNTFLNFFRGELCENRTMRGLIDIHYVPNWINSGYYCDIKRITSEKPDDARKDDRWKSLITCYECNAP